MELLVFWLIMGGVVAIIAGSKGFNWFGWMLYGMAIWPIALVHVLVARSASAPTPIPVVITEGLVARPARSNSDPTPRQPSPTMKTCPDCAEQVQAAARICRFCRHEFSEAPPTITVAPPQPRIRHTPFGMKPCPSCGENNWHDATRCSQCGTTFAMASPKAPPGLRKVCATCGEDSAAHVDRCPKCSTFFPLAPPPADPPVG